MEHIRLTSKTPQWVGLFSKPILLYISNIRKTQSFQFILASELHFHLFCEPALLNSMQHTSLKPAGPFWNIYKMIVFYEVAEFETLRYIRLRRATYWRTFNFIRFDKQLFFNMTSWNPFPSDSYDVIYCNRRMSPQHFCNEDKSLSWYQFLPSFKFASTYL